MKKASIYLGILTLAMGMFLTGCGKNSNENGDIGDESETVVIGEETEGEELSSETEEAVQTFSGDWDAVEEYGYPPFWLKYADLGSLEEKDISDVVLYDTFACGEDLAEILTHYKHFDVWPFSGARLLEATDYEDLLNNTEIMIEPNDHVKIYAQVESEDDYNNSKDIFLYNLTDTDITLAEAIANNEFYIDFPSGESGDYCYTDQALGMEYNVSEYRTNMTEIMNILGKPTSVYEGYTSLLYTDREGEEEDFATTVQKGGGNITYHIVYDKGDYIICLRVLELHNNTAHRGYSKLAYYTPGVFDYKEVVDESEIYEFE